MLDIPSIRTRARSEWLPTNRISAHTRTSRIEKLREVDGQLKLMIFGGMLKTEKKKHLFQD